MKGQSVWKIQSIADVVGEGFPNAQSLIITSSRDTSHIASNECTWQLLGIGSNIRYATRAEVSELARKQAHLGSSEFTHGALIPIKKSTVWWELPQDEHRRIFEEDSKHISFSMAYVDKIARKLMHCRDFGQPFDFLTWFEYAPAHANYFEELVSHLRLSAEWNYGRKRN